MSAVVAFNSAPARRNTRRARRLAIIAEIIQALENLGGSAHYDSVIDHIAAERKLIDPHARAALRWQILEVFTAHCETDGKDCDQAMFRKVYGPESRRWGLSRSFHERLQQGVVDLEQHIV